MVNLRFPSQQSRLQPYDDMGRRRSFLYNLAAAMMYVSAGSSHAVLSLGLGTWSSSTIVNNRTQYVLKELQSYTAFKSCTSLQQALCIAASNDFHADDGAPSWMMSALSAASQFCMSTITVGLGVTVSELLGQQALQYTPRMSTADILEEILFASLTLTRSMDLKTASIDTVRGVVADIKHQQLGRLHRFVNSCSFELAACQDDICHHMHNLDQVVDTLHACIQQMDAVFAYTIHATSITTDNHIVLNDFEPIAVPTLTNVGNMSDLDNIRSYLAVLVDGFVTCTNMTVKLQLTYLASKQLVGIDRGKLSYGGGLNTKIDYKNVKRTIHAAVRTLYAHHTFHSGMLKEFMDKFVVVYGQVFQQSMSRHVQQLEDLESEFADMQATLQVLKAEYDTIDDQLTHMNTMFNEHFTVQNPKDVTEPRVLDDINESMAKLSFTKGYNLNNTVDVHRDLLECSETDAERLYPHFKSHIRHWVDGNDKFSTDTLSTHRDKNPVGYMNYIQNVVIKQNRKNYQSILAYSTKLLEHLNTTTNSTDIGDDIVDLMAKKLMRMGNVIVNSDKFHPMELAMCANAIVEAGGNKTSALMDTRARLEQMRADANDDDWESMVRGLFVPYDAHIVYDKGLFKYKVEGDTGTEYLKMYYVQNIEDSTTTFTHSKNNYIGYKPTNDWFKTDERGLHYNPFKGTHQHMRGDVVHLRDTSGDYELYKIREPLQLIPNDDIKVDPLDAFIGCVQPDSSVIVVSKDNYKALLALASHQPTVTIEGYLCLTEPYDGPHFKTDATLDSIKSCQDEDITFQNGNWIGGNPSDYIFYEHLRDLYAGIDLHTDRVEFDIDNDKHSPGEYNLAISYDIRVTHILWDPVDESKYVEVNNFATPTTKYYKLKDANGTPINTAFVDVTNNMSVVDPSGTEHTVIKPVPSSSKYLVGGIEYTLDTTTQYEPDSDAMYYYKLSNTPGGTDHYVLVGTFEPKDPSVVKRFIEYGTYTGGNFTALYTLDMTDEFVLVASKPYSFKEHIFKIDSNNKMYAIDKNEWVCKSDPALFTRRIYYDKQTNTELQFPSSPIQQFYDENGVPGDDGTYILLGDSTSVDISRLLPKSLLPGEFSTIGYALYAIHSWKRLAVAAYRDIISDAPLTLDTNIVYNANGVVDPIGEYFSFSNMPNGGDRTQYLVPKNGTVRDPLEKQWTDNIIAVSKKQEFIYVLDHSSMDSNWLLIDITYVNEAPPNPQETTSALANRIALHVSRDEKLKTSYRPTRSSFKRRMHVLTDTNILDPYLPRTTLHLMQLGVPALVHFTFRAYVLKLIYDDYANLQNIKEDNVSLDNRLETIMQTAHDAIFTAGKNAEVVMTLKQIEDLVKTMESINFSRAKDFMNTYALKLFETYSTKMFKTRYEGTFDIHEEMMIKNPKQFLDIYPNENVMHDGETGVLDPWLAVLTYAWVTGCHDQHILTDEQRDYLLYCDFHTLAHEMTTIMHKLFHQKYEWSFSERMWNFKLSSVNVTSCVTNIEMGKILNETAEQIKFAYLLLRGAQFSNQNIADMNCMQLLQDRELFLLPRLAMLSYNGNLTMSTDIMNLQHDAIQHEYSRFQEKSSVFEERMKQYMDTKKHLETLRIELDAQQRYAKNQYEEYRQHNDMCEVQACLSKTREQVIVFKRQQQECENAQEEVSSAFECVRSHTRC